jgi:hypothetical protein
VRTPAARVHVLGKRAQPGKILLDAGVVDEIAGTGTPHQQPFRHQAVERLAHRQPRHAQVRRQLALGRQGIVRQQALGDCLRSVRCNC